MNPADVTAVILTRDEERNLPRALTSLPKGMHMFVLDACSTDHTIQFARGAGAEVVQREWTDFLDARRFALGHVRTPWVLMLDADEALDDVLRDAIERADPAIDGYRVRRTTYFCGRPMRLWRDEPLLRLFKRDRAHLESAPATDADAALHERWVGDGSVAELTGSLLHYSYPDASAYRKKFAQYTAIEAEGSRASVGALLAACLRAAVRFPYFLLAKGALLDGLGGIYVACGSATYPIAVAWKALLR
ncbi:MAG TPA: glycosyltransferase family 2 protein [Candidatus Baltobacteraceae bacterium]